MGQSPTDPPRRLARSDLRLAPPHGADGAVRDWSFRERFDLARAERSVRQGRPTVFREVGLTDAGEPWAVLFDQDADEVVLHVARLGDRVWAAVPDRDLAVSGATLREALARAAPLLALEAAPPAEEATRRGPILRVIRGDLAPAWTIATALGLALESVAGRRRAAAQTKRAEDAVSDKAAQILAEVKRRVQTAQTEQAELISQRANAETVRALEVAAAAIIVDIALAVASDAAPPEPEHLSAMGAAETVESAFADGEAPEANRAAPEPQTTRFEKPQPGDAEKSALSAKPQERQATDGGAGAAPSELIDAPTVAPSAAPAEHLAVHHLAHHGAVDPNAEESSAAKAEEKAEDAPSHKPAESADHPPPEHHASAEHPTHDHPTHDAHHPPTDLHDPHHATQDVEAGQPQAHPLEADDAANAPAHSDPETAARETAADEEAAFAFHPQPESGLDDQPLAAEPADSGVPQGDAAGAAPPAAAASVETAPRETEDALHWL